MCNSAATFSLQHHQYHYIHLLHHHHHHILNGHVGSIIITILNIIFSVIRMFIIMGLNFKFNSSQNSGLENPMNSLLSIFRKFRFRQLKVRSKHFSIGFFNVERLNSSNCQRWLIKCKTPNLA